MGINSLSKNDQKILTFFVPLELLQSTFAVVVCTFICQLPQIQPFDTETTFCGFPSQAATWYYQSNHSKVEVIPLSALPKGKTSELANLISFMAFFILI